MPLLRRLLILPLGVLACGGMLVSAGCVSLPPAAMQPKPISNAVDPALQSTLGRAFQPLAAAHAGDSGFRLISTGIDGLTARLEMIDASQRSLDVQSYIFRSDESGNLVVQALLRAADRGVRVRVLTDDADTVPGDERILALAAHRGIEVRIFNPFRYRGHRRALRAAEFLFNKTRLDYRMHNKLMVADNAAAIIGGRNIGDQYFQIDPASQFGDDDVVVAGPIVPRLSGVFDEFWNGPLAVPAQAVDPHDASAGALSRYLERLAEYRRRLDATPAEPHPDGAPAAPKTPFTDIISGKTPLTWSPVKLAYDSPDKKAVEKGDAPGRLIYKALAEQANAVAGELLMVTPYFVPSSDELAVLKGERRRNARVRILTNSLEATPSLGAHSGYMHFRVPLLQEGVELYEIRALLGSTRGSGQTRAISRHGNYALHAKLYVFDRSACFIGSMNFDQRSKHLNTEIGLMIASAELSRQLAARFEELTGLDDAYALSLAPGKSRTPHVVWTTKDAGRVVRLETEPARSVWQRTMVNILALLPLDREL